MAKFYEKHKCSLLVPLVLLIGIDVLSFIHIIGELKLFPISIKTEMFIFTVCITMTYYYLFKQSTNIRHYYCMFKKLIKRWKK